MEKNTLLAVVLSVAVLFGFYIVQGIFFPPAPPPVTIAPGEIPQPPVGQVTPADQPDVTAPFTPGAWAAPDVPEVTPVAEAAAEATHEELIHINTDLLSVVLTNAGGNIVSFRLNEHRDGDDVVEMIFSGDSDARAFTLAFGGPNEQPQTALFNVHRISEHSVRFYRYFSLPNNPDARFRLDKEYRFHHGEYMFELVVRLDGGHLVPGFNFNGSAYTLSFGPQIGPTFQRLDRRQDFRMYFTFDGRRRRSQNANDSIITTAPRWAAISGRFFTFIAIPVLPGGFNLSFSERPELGVPSASRMHIIRPPLNTSRTEDVFRFYLGPRRPEILHSFNTGNNAFNLHNMQLDEMAGNIWGWTLPLGPLERALLWLLTSFYGMTGNYGIAIILLTLLVRIVFFPLSKKGSESMLRMQEFAPKMKELQEKYKDNRQKLNMEMAELYKKGGYNPLKGCLPMLLQFPIFIAMFQLFNNHFELRNAMFIPGWIPDLSVPEYVWAFPDGIQLPLLGWNAFRLLPFIYVGSQLLYGKVTQSPEQKANPQMKMIMYLMPIVFFFVLYDMPSGLLVYWTSSNVLTMIQQVAIMKYLRKKKAEQAANAPPSPVIVPQKKKGGKIAGTSSGVIPPPKKKKRR